MRLKSKVQTFGILFVGHSFDIWIFEFVIFDIY